jgi:hypothetical protein
MRFIDPSGLMEEDPQAQPNPQQEKPPIKVAIVPSVVQVFSDVELSNGKHMTGVGSVFKITLKDANDDPLAEATVSETNTRIEGTGDINDNHATVKTSLFGEFGDYVVRGRTTETSDPQSPKSKEQVQTFKDAVNETPIRTTTEQTLSVTGNDKQKYDITYRRTITNIGPDGKLLKEKNREGLNVKVSYTTPVVKRVP